MSDNKHLTLDNRYDIQHSLDDGLSFKAIALNLGKDCSTISKRGKSAISSSKRKELPTNHSTIVFTDSIANTMLPPVRFAAASIVINAAPVEMHKRMSGLCERKLLPSSEASLCVQRMSQAQHLHSGKHLYHAHQAHMEYMEVRSGIKIRF